MDFTHRDCRNRVPSTEGTELLCQVEKNKNLFHQIYNKLMLSRVKFSPDEIKCNILIQGNQNCSILVLMLTLILFNPDQSHSYFGAYSFVECFAFGKTTFQMDFLIFAQFLSTVCINTYAMWKIMIFECLAILSHPGTYILSKLL